MAARPRRGSHTDRMELSIAFFCKNMVVIGFGRECLRLQRS